MRIATTNSNAADTILVSRYHRFNQDVSKEYTIKKRYIHPNYNVESYPYDIMLLQVRLEEETGNVNDEDDNPPQYIRVALQHEQREQEDEQSQETAATAAAAATTATSSSSPPSSSIRAASDSNKLIVIGMGDAVPGESVVSIHFVTN